jgi:hypothetical protein
MEDRCIDLERLGQVMELPDEHPDRLHAKTCPRCWSLLESCQQFLQAERVPGSGIEGVRGALDAHIREDAARWTPRGMPPATAPAAPTVPAATWWRFLLRPVPMAVTGALVIAAGALWRSLTPEPSAIRQDSTISEAFVVHPAEISADGAIHLAWNPVDGADHYQVRIYGPDLSEVYRSPNVPETSLTVNRSILPAALPATLDLTWRVFAIVHSDVVGSSGPASISTR